MKHVFFFVLLSFALALTGCTKRSESATVSSDSLEATEYGKRLAAVRARYPFSHWAQSGLPQYTRKSSAAFASVFDRLLMDLAALGESATEKDKLECFHRAGLSLNDLNRKDPTLIETDEREQLCELSNFVAVAAGLDPKKYGHGEGPASIWRDW